MRSTATNGNTSHCSSDSRRKNGVTKSAGIMNGNVTINSAAEMIDDIGPSPTVLPQSGTQSHAREVNDLVLLFQGSQRRPDLTRRLCGAEGVEVTTDSTN